MPRPKVDRAPRRGKEEEKFQRACAEYLALMCKTNALFRGLVWFHVPNGGWRTASEGAAFKAMGVRPGVSDFIFCLPPRGRFAAIELKIAPNKPTSAQDQFLADVNAAGSDRIGVAYNIHQFVELITKWLNEERNGGGPFS